jgi:hypothetical protein
MRRRKPNIVKIPRADQQETKRLLRDGRTEQRVVRRAQVLLAMKNSKTVAEEPCQKVHMTRIGIWFLCRRYETAGLNAIYDAPRSGRPREISTLERVFIEQLACSASFLHARYGNWLRIVSTPAHSSWLNQAEILLKCFDVRYLQRDDWSSRQQLIDHLLASTPEYNRLWAQPINWSWTRRDLRNWAEKKSK